MSDYRTFAEFSENAQTGDAEALYQLGICYSEGKGVEQNYQMAAKMWLQAAKQKHAFAQMRLGMLFEQGLGVSQQYAKAMQCYQSASKLNLAEAKVRLAKMYYKGLGVEQDTQKAILFCIQAAEQGDPDAQFYLATAYYRGIGRLTKNKNLAVFWYQQASMQNHERATEALKIIEQKKALQQFVSPAPKLVDMLLAKQSSMSKKTDIHQPKHDEKSTNIVTKTETKIDTPEPEKQQPAKEPLNIQFNTVTSSDSPKSSMHGLNNIQILTTGLESQVISLRIKTPKGAVSTNSSKSTTPTNHDVQPVKKTRPIVHHDPKNLLPEIKQFITQAEQGDAKGQYNTALSFMFGLGGQIFDIDKALEWLKKSAEQEFRPACVVLGWIYEGGLTTYYQITGQTWFNEIAIDNEKSLYYYRKAGEMGHAQAQYFLAKIYEIGKNVNENQETSLTWLRQSAKQGYLKAFEELEKTAG